MDSWDNNFEFVKQWLFPSAFPLKKTAVPAALHGGMAATGRCMAATASTWTWIGCIGSLQDGDVYD